MHRKKHATFSILAMSINRVKLHTYPHLVVNGNYFGINFEI